MAVVSPALLLGKCLLVTLSVVARIQFLASGWKRGLFLIDCRLKVALGSWSSGLLHLDSTTWKFAFSKLARERNCPCKMGITIICNVITFM